MAATVGSVQSQLDQFAAEFASQVPQEVREVMERAGNRVDEIIAGQAVLDVDAQARDFELPDASGRMVNSSELLQKGPLVLTFYRGGWCPYCNIELRALQAALPEIKSLGASLVAVSPETPDQSLSTSEKNELEFSVLSDVGNKVAKQYGLVFSLPEELRPIYADFGIDVPAHNGDDSFELPVPATYVIDRQGKIRYAFANADYRRRAEPTEIVEVLSRIDGESRR